MDLALADLGERPADHLNPHDVVIHGVVSYADYGKHEIRYLLGVLPRFKFGVCRLEIDLDIEDGKGSRQPLRSKAMQTVSLFGGSSRSLMMKANIKTLAHRTATVMARLVTGQHFLNLKAYTYATCALILGFLSLIPFVGVAGVLTGTIALRTIKERRLPRGEGIALAGVLVCVLGLLVTIAFIAVRFFGK